MKIKEEELKTIQEQQTKLNELVHNIGLLESQKHGLLHEIAAANKDIEEYKACLLYTSPSPRDRTRSRMPSSA